VLTAVTRSPTSKNLVAYDKFARSTAVDILHKIRWPARVEEKVVIIGARTEGEVLRPEEIRNQRIVIFVEVEI